MQIPSVDPIEDAGLRAVEFLIPFAVLVGELNRKFEVRAMKACITLDLPTAGPEDAFQVRDVLEKKSKTSATSRVHQRAFNCRRRSASYTFHNIHVSLDRQILLRFHVQGIF